MGSVSNTEEENRRLREQLAVLRREAEENDAILKRAQARELSLLQADSLVALFDEIADGLRRAHGLDSVTLVLLDPDHQVRPLAMGE